MKKVILVLGIFAICASANAIPGYKMQADDCPGGGTYNACRESPGEICWISEQTLCDM